MKLLSKKEGQLGNDVINFNLCKKKEKKNDFVYLYINFIHQLNAKQKQILMEDIIGF